MRRREFITLLGGTMAAWPLGARTQERIRRVGVLTGAGGPNDEEAPARKAAWEQGLERAGWVEGGNLRIDYRFPAANPEATRRYAAELVALARFADGSDFAERLREGILDGAPETVRRVIEPVLLQYGVG